jgi:hypothetical protein
MVFSVEFERGAVAPIRLARLGLRGHGWATRSNRVQVLQRGAILVSLRSGFATGNLENCRGRSRRYGGARRKPNTEVTVIRMERAFIPLRRLIRRLMIVRVLAAAVIVAVMVLSDVLMFVTTTWSDRVRPCVQSLTQTAGPDGGEQANDRRQFSSPFGHSLSPTGNGSI